MERIRFISHRGQRVLLADLSGCSAQQLGELVESVPPYVAKETPNSVLLLADFSGSEFTRETVERLKIAAVFTRPHLKNSAWVLDNNLPKALLDSIRTFSARRIETFENREAALDYLTTEPAAD